jgi:DNA-binding GntR family transcriptional regulator
MAADGTRVLYREVAADIRGRIRSGALAPGEQLGSLRAMAGQYNVAVNTLRDALRLLRDESLVETLPGKGTFVTGVPAGPEDAWREAAEKRIDTLEAQVAELRAVTGLERDRDGREAQAQ